ncbi:septal ring lytic transglycosylase RlpA family protein [Teredinibacter haidensis]|uniref:septal ring lytic transglycosylase RlpA family protein n=1 Tax=Teredinibacter haidensis TaxID=2731755 RepID=UPI000948E20C|nr:septal ring lytic transglycosylase RlpA family protein [Teredinibacter haidensis]
MIIRVVFQCLLPVLLACLCACEAPSVYTMKEDAGPSQSMGVDHIPDAVPRYEPRTIAGNKSPYKVLGKTYHVLASPEKYKAEGMASWYGKKFHGHKTSNGEIYNMYGMTAAHKTLPIPSYVRVTNRNNGHSVIVRVNDRGPFHGHRVIDLTYTAAKKLGFVEKGTAPVVVEYIDPASYQKVASANAPARTAPSSQGETPAPTPAHSGGYGIPGNTFLQVGAFGQRETAERLQQKLQALTAYPVHIYFPDNARLYRVRIGPLKDSLDLLALREKLVNNQLHDAHVVYQ